jgi:cysteine desulfurase
MPDPVYLDYNATTPVAPEVREAMLAALDAAWANPSAAHPLGRQARRAVEEARDPVAVLIGCDPDEIVFTSGGTESDNAAIVGVAEALRSRGRHLVVSAIEHAAVEEACRWLEGRGWEVTRVGVSRRGVVEPAALERAIRSETVLVSVIHAQNETGVLQPIAEIARITRARGIPLHTDAAQSVGKVPVNVRELGCDLLTVAGHKLYAPKGVGALYVRRGTPFEPFLRGAPHEQGRRAGTENVPGIVGLGAAADLALSELEKRRVWMERLRDRLEAALLAAIPEAVVHGSGAPRLPNTLSIAIPGTDANEMLEAMEGVAASPGAACHAGKSEPSRVLIAMGVAPDLARATLRLTAGRVTTETEVDLAARRIVEAATRLRARRLS